METATQPQQKRVSLFDLDIREMELLGAVEDALTSLEANGGEEAQALVDQYLDQLTDTQAELHTKLAGYVKIIKAKNAHAAMLEAEAELYRAEFERLTNLAADEQNDAEFFEARLKLFLERRGIKELPVGTHKLKIANQGGSRAVQYLAEVDPELVPKQFTRLTPPIPSKLVFDAAAIQAELKKLADGAPLVVSIPGPDGQPQQVEWARLAPRKTVLKIV